MTQENKTSAFDLEGEIKQVFRMPQCLTEALSVDFVCQGVDLFVTNPDWCQTDDDKRKSRVEKVLEKMESENQVTSKVVQVKHRHFDDDIEAPKLPKRVRVYSLVR